MSPSSTSVPSSLNPPPILLLKTKSTPHDGYADFFSAHGFAPTFVPVLEHRLHEGNLRYVHDSFASGEFGHINSYSRHNASGNGSNRKYGGLIFTSQRAVEGFASMLDEAEFSLKEQATEEQNLPLILYTVGPATARALASLRDAHLPHDTLIIGADAGTGEKLAQFILEHYNSLYRDSNFNENTKPALLFLVGEQRRDIIPKTLMSESLSPAERIAVEEVVVYETGVMDSFEVDFEDAIGKTYTPTPTTNTSTGGNNVDIMKGNERDNILWVVVFSPTGCEAMLRVLGLGPFHHHSHPSHPGSVSHTQLLDNKRIRNGRRVCIATIGPTTRDYLREQFGFEVDVVADKPSPEGLGAAIERFMREQLI